MGKTGKWFRNFLAGGKKKDKDKDKEKEKENVERIGGLSSPLPNETRSAPISASTTKEKRRWSFRRPALVAGKEPNSPDLLASTPNHGFLEPEMDQKRHAMAVAVATAAAADAAVAAVQAAAAVIRLTAANSSRNRISAVEDAAAVKIQAAFRSHLAKKALRALKGLVKLQALVRGHLVRKQATATLFCMQSLVMIQARARAQRSQMLEESRTSTPHRQPPVDRRSPQHPPFRRSYEMERSLEENVKIVEMDLGESRGRSFKSRNSYSITQSERTENKFSAYGGSRMDSMADPYQQVWLAPSALTDVSPRACSGHYEDFSFTTPQSSPHYFSATSIPDATRSSFIVSHHEGTYPMSNDYPFFPNYMANTESSKAKARSQSAPKQRPDTYERQPSRRRQSVEGRNIPRSARMQRSSSHVGASTNGHQYPWSIKLDKSSMSLKDSECGSTSTILTNTNYCRFMGIDK